MALYVRVAMAHAINAARPKVMARAQFAAVGSSQPTALLLLIFAGLERKRIKFDHPPIVIPGLDPEIHADGRVKPGHDDNGRDST